MGEVNGNVNVDVGKEVKRSALNAAVHEVMAVGNNVYIPGCNDFRRCIEGILYSETA